MRSEEIRRLKTIRANHQLLENEKAALLKMQAEIPTLFAAMNFDRKRHVAELDEAFRHLSRTWPSTLPN